MPLRKVWPSLCQFLEIHVAQQLYGQIAYTIFYHSQSVNAESMRRTSFMPASKRRLLLHWCSHNSWSHNKFLWKFLLSIPPLQLAEKCRKCGLIYFVPLSNIWLSVLKISRNSDLLNGIMCALVCQFSPKCVNEYGRYREIYLRSWISK